MAKYSSGRRRDPTEWSGDIDRHRGAVVEVSEVSHPTGYEIFYLQGRGKSNYNEGLMYAVVELTLLTLNQLKNKL